jgi:uncharacterized protein YjiS (DUF1127 family)
MENAMTRAIRRWRTDRRYRATLRRLQGLSTRELGHLGIPPTDLKRLASELSRV